jgi:putative copper export protein
MATDSGLDAVRQLVLRRWLEVLLPAYTLGLLFVWLHQEYTPAVLGQSMNESPWPWIAWALVGAMTGILVLWGVIVAFFLCYSPLYLLGKTPLLLGGRAWVDKRELQFYVCCFLLLSLLAALAYWDAWVGFIAFTLVAGCGPVFWRYLV